VCQYRFVSPESCQYRFVSPESPGLSRYEIAKRSGVSEATLSRFVNGQQGLSTDTLDKLANVLGLELVARQPKGGKTKGR